MRLRPDDVHPCLAVRAGNWPGGAFERAYGPAGDWARLFAVVGGYRGTDLLRDAASHHYLVIDRWDSRDAWDEFLSAHRSAYDTLDRHCRPLLVREALSGEFEEVD